MRQALRFGKKEQCQIIVFLRLQLTECFPVCSQIFPMAALRLRCNLCLFYQWHLVVLLVKTSWGAENALHIMVVQPGFSATMSRRGSLHSRLWGDLKTRISPYLLHMQEASAWEVTTGFLLSPFPPKYVRIGETCSWHLVGLLNEFSEKDVEYNCKI